MKKVFGIEAEINITADEDIVKGIGKGISNGSVIISDIISEMKPVLKKAVTDYVTEDKKNVKTTESKE